MRQGTVSWRGALGTAHGGMGVLGSVPRSAKFDNGREGCWCPVPPWAGTPAHSRGCACAPSPLQGECLSAGDCGGAHDPGQLLKAFTPEVRTVLPLHRHKAVEVAGGSVCPQGGVSVPGSDGGSTAGVTLYRGDTDRWHMLAKTVTGGTLL